MGTKILPFFCPLVKKFVSPAAGVKNGLVQPSYSKEIPFIIMPLAARSCIRATTKKNSKLSTQQYFTSIFLLKKSELQFGRIIYLATAKIVCEKISNMRKKKRAIDAF